MVEADLSLVMEGLVGKFQRQAKHSHPPLAGHPVSGIEERITAQMVFEACGLNLFFLLGRSWWICHKITILAIVVGCREMTSCPRGRQWSFACRARQVLLHIIFIAIPTILSCASKSRAFSGSHGSCKV